MPQIEQLASTYAGQVFWMLIVFALIYFGIGKAMLPKIESTVEGRERRIADDLAAAERAQAEADAGEEAYRVRMNEARATSLAQNQDAKARAQAASEARVKQADAVLAGASATAEASLSAARTDALSHLESVAAEITQDLVARLAGLTVSTDEAATAVRRAATAQ
ncbi:ATPase [Sphingomonas naphthae]|uniref:ATP synthase subunit b n=1 Tax=Sphingomonas naphthae TaxID=1813468 RepID=A0ABY7TGC8_9SPHN|nr:ATPase [Sphingomonas naphthae]WCT72118.1 ATPase [Sphingomonas naphthae]